MVPPDRKPLLNSKFNILNSVNWKLMKQTLPFILLISLSLFACEKRLSSSEVITRQNGLVFQRTQEQLYSGTLVDSYSNGVIKSQFHYKEGKRDGKCVEWTQEGRKLWQQEYKDGKEEGKWIEWFANSKVRVEANFHNGVREGLFTEYYNNGQKKIEGRFQNGLKEGTWKELTFSENAANEKLFSHGVEVTGE